MRGATYFLVWETQLEQWLLPSKSFKKKHSSAQKADPNTWVYRSHEFKPELFSSGMEQCSYGGGNVREPWLQSHIQKEPWATMGQPRQNLKSVIPGSLIQKSKIQSLDLMAEASSSKYVWSSATGKMPDLKGSHWDSWTTGESVSAVWFSISISML